MADLKLLDAALSRLQVSRNGEIVHLVMPGEGALITPTEEFNVAQKWARRRNSTGSPARDRYLLLDQLPTVIARSGSLISTRGSRKPLETLVRAMRSAGFAPEEWSLPADLKARSPAPSTETPRSSPAAQAEAEEAAPEETPGDETPDED